MTDRVRITDVSPRDGLQNEAGVVPTERKVELVRLLARTGVDEIETASFVSPKWIPQLADAETLLGALRESLPPEAPLLSALVPNERGLERALPFHTRETPLKVALFTAASETFSKKNTNASIDETLARFAPVIERALAAGAPVRAYISCAVECPYEGPTDPARVARLAERLVELGAQEIDLGDTIGAATAQTTAELLHEAHPAIATLDGPYTLTLHLHDTFGRAAACVRAALTEGVRSFDGAVAGLGGCPYASKEGKPAPGNVSTRLLVETASGEGLRTGVDLAALGRAETFARQIVAAARAGASV